MGWIPPRLTRAHRNAVARQLRALSPKDQRQLRRHAYREANLNRRAMAWGLGVPMLIGGACLALYFLDQRRSFLPEASETVAGLLVVGAIAVGELIKTRIQSRRMASAFPFICRVCGHDLRPTPDLCPECGTSAESKK